MIEDRDTILELAGKIQELQNEINCMTDPRVFENMLNQYALDNSPLPLNHCFSHRIQILVECRAAEKGRQVFGTHMVYRETFLQIQQRLLQHLIRRS